MNWNSAGEFFAMGGYALFVWGSFGACAVVLVAEPLLAGRRRAAVLRTLRARVRAERLSRENA
jgi:heme exporter protein D